MKAKLLESRPSVSKFSNSKKMLKPGTIVYITGHNKMGRMTAETAAGYCLNIGEDDAEPIEY